MPFRVLASFLAFVLFWSALGTVEAPRILAQPSPGHQHAVAPSGGQVAAHEGSVEHHHLDDLPSQAQGDPTLDTPALPPSPLKRAPALLKLPQPPGFVSAATGSPCLAGPLRPPCAPALAG